MLQATDDDMLMHEIKKKRKGAIVAKLEAEETKRRPSFQLSQVKPTTDDGLTRAST